MTHQPQHSQQSEQSALFLMLNQRLFEEQDELSTLVTTLEEIEQQAQSHPDREWFDLLAHAFSRLREATEDAPEAAAPIIFEHLIPWLITPGLEAADYGRSRGRETVREWLDQYAETDRSRLMTRVLDVLHAYLNEHQQISLEHICWTIAAISRRRPDLVKSLWRIVKANDTTTGDTALRALASLGLPEQERPRFYPTLHKRLRRRMTPVLIGAANVLADASSIASLHVGLKQLLDGREPSIAFAYGLQTLAKIASAYPADDHVQDKVWSIIRTLYYYRPEFSALALLLGSEIAPRCNVRSVVPDLLALVPAYAGTEEEFTYQRHLLYLRAGECIRPQQLAGTEDPVPVEVRALLRRDATQNTGYTRRFATGATLMKESAWRMLLHRADPIVLSSEFLTEAVFGEENVYVGEKLMECLAVFRWEPLPSEVVDLITASIDLTRETVSEELPLRKSATLLARSAATHDAFTVLLQVGYTFEHEALRESATALASVALQLQRQGEPGIVEALINATAVERPRHHRIIAFHALEALAGERLLELRYATTLLSLAEANTRDIRERQGAVDVLAALLWAHVQDGGVGSEFGDGEKMREALLHLALVDDVIASSAVEALAQCGALLDMPDLLTKYVPLRLVVPQNGDGNVTLPDDVERSTTTGNTTSISLWDLTEPTPNDWAKRLIATLYVQAPDRLWPTMVTLLNNATAFEMMPLAWALDRAHGALSEQRFKGNLSRQPSRRRLVPGPIREAVLDNLTRQRNSLFSVSEALIGVTARIMPTEILRLDWSEYWSNWSWSARRALVDALVEAALVAKENNARATHDEAIKMVLLLVGDSQYGVRRAAYWGLARLSPSAFVGMCAVGAVSPSVGLRRRAAEALGWEPALQEPSDDVRARNQKAEAEAPKFRDSSSSDSQPSHTFAASVWTQEARAALAVIQNQLEEDVDPLVREAVDNALKERQQHIWSAAYLHQIMATCRQKQVTNNAILATWRYGRALIAVGDDAVLVSIEQQLAHGQLAPHIAHWLRMLHRDLEEAWKKRSEEWPEPWRVWSGKLQYAIVTLVLPNGKTVAGTLVVSDCDPLELSEGMIASGREGAFLPDASDALPATRIRSAMNVQLRQGIQGTARLMVTTGAVPWLLTDLKYRGDEQ